MHFSKDSPAGDAAAASTVSLAAVARIAAAAAAAMYAPSEHACGLAVKAGSAALGCSPNGH